MLRQKATQSWASCAIIKKKPNVMENPKKRCKAGKTKFQIARAKEYWSKKSIVINPIVGVYIPIIRIPIEGGMTIPNIATFDHGTYRSNPFIL